MTQKQCPYCHDYVAESSFEQHVQEHKQLLPDGQQKDYVTLPPAQRDTSSLVDVPSVYVHQMCGVATVMPEEIVRSYLKNPFLYFADTTFCCGCGKQVPYRQCVWKDTGESLQTYFNELRAQNPQMDPRPKAVTTAPPSTDASTKSSSGSTLSGVVILLGIVLGMGVLKNLPKAVMNQQANGGGQIQQKQANQNIPGENEWNAKIRRGEDVPDAILILAGIDPSDYKSKQKILRSYNIIEQSKKLLAQGNALDAVKKLDEGLESDPEDAILHNTKAWTLSTHTENDIRDGELAITHATKACELTNYENPSYLDTLAAAYAEAKKFESAIKFVQQAIDLSDDEPLRERMLSRLEMYKNSQPVRN